MSMMWLCLVAWSVFGLIGLTVAVWRSPAATMTEEEWNESIKVNADPDFYPGLGGRWSHRGIERQREWLWVALIWFVLWVIVALGIIAAFNGHPTTTRG